MVETTCCGHEWLSGYRIRSIHSLPDPHPTHKCKKVFRDNTMRIETPFKSTRLPIAEHAIAILSVRSQQTIRALFLLIRRHSRILSGVGKDTDKSETCERRHSRNHGDGLQNVNIVDIFYYPPHSVSNVHTQASRLGNFRVTLKTVETAMRYLPASVGSPNGIPPQTCRKVTTLIKKVAECCPIKLCCLKTICYYLGGPIIAQVNLNQ